MLKRFLLEEKGQSMVLFSLLIVVLIGFTGLAIDGGRLYLAKSQLQKAVDAGALAGANVIVTNTGFDYSTAENTAKSISTRNYANSKITYTPKASLDPSDNVNYLQVNGKEKVSLMLMPVLGISDRNVTAVAKVKIGKIIKVEQGNIIPIGIHLNQPLEFGALWKISEAPGSAYKGNFNLLNFASIDPDGNSNGSKSVGYYIANGSPVPMYIDQKLSTKTGDPINSNPIKTAIDGLKGKIVYVPIVSDFGSGQSEVTILGFAAFEMIGYDKEKGNNVIQAKFIKELLPGEIGDVKTEYGTYASALVM
ncbi:TadE/TadG family type IV pilus assembly protein [Neobacillus sp.]|uniref:TadE/TadG family type IV pilus assembly protein n=1 Tax=Neobacillus sp. TaxID=2675273 RepID=UPI0028A0B929|nr:TadE/TadG family type IV pilus assembly protein [Neobacillus sp.]